MLRIIFIHLSVFSSSTTQHAVFSDKGWNLCPLAVEVQSLNQWMAKEVPRIIFIFAYLIGETCSIIILICMSLLMKLGLCYWQLIFHLQRCACLYPLPIFQGKETQNGRKILGSFLIVLCMAWVPDSPLKRFGGATEEEQETSHRNEQKWLKEWV